MIKLKFKRKDEKRRLAKRLVNTTEGITLLKYCQEDYLLRSPIDKECVLQTHVNIGYQQCIKDLIKLVEDRSRFERVKTINERGDNT
jgi:hypothetical protein